MAIFIAVICMVVLLCLVLFPGRNPYKAPETMSLSNAKQICLACKQYAADNSGHFPPSLDALSSKYLPDRSVLVSPLMPGEPGGYTYTPPGPGKTDSPDTVVIEDNFAPTLKHVRIVAYANDTARVLNIP